ncbi:MULTISPECIES: colicin-like pore-forming protein [Enterobacter]|jgi:hypothetical protein|uniref:colicin-like pore-forming protein n=1 Tax=Enterobacter TaxID=547 RepID=UPI00163AC3AC|nr:MULTISPECIES: colicin-like pore-forming protein [Enterobacter]MBK1520754.1 hypothetical protein [Enterobacter ludwigii]MDR6368640.1 hypothetical protein [Enterobacter sp. SORGH_AS_0287]
MPGFTGFGGSWNNGVHSGGDDSGSIGGGSGNTSQALGQFAKLTGVKPSEVSNFRSDGEGGWSGDIAGVGPVHAFADEMGGYTSPTGNSGGSGTKHTSWGELSNDGTGNSTMNGIKLTAENSQVVNETPTSQVRVLNSILDRSFMKPEPGEHSGVTGVSATTPSRITLANNAVTAAQLKAKLAADNLAKANANVPQAKSRLAIAENAIPKLQAEVNTTQKVFDTAQAKASSMAEFAKADPISNQFRAWQQAGYEAQKAQNALNSSKKALANGKSEITAAQQALADAQKALPIAVTNKQNADKDVASATDMKDAITTTTAFFESVSKKFGDRAARLAQEFAAQARSAKIRSVPEALALFDKYKGTAVNKLNAADKAAISNAFKSLNQADIAKQLAAYSKVLGTFNKAMDLADLGAAVKKGIETGEWKDAITKLESIALTNTAGQLAAIAFAAAGMPMGIIGFGITLTLAGVIFSNENVLKAINSSLGM